MSHHAKELYHAIKGKLNEIIGEISNNEVLRFKGEKEKLAGHLQNKFDLDHEEAKTQATKLILESEDKKLNGN